MSVVSTVSSKARGQAPAMPLRRPPCGENNPDKSRQKQTGATPKDRAGSEHWPRKVPSDAEADVLRRKTG